MPTPPDPSERAAPAPTSHLVLVVPAAGASRRLGECKALVDFSGQSALERLVRAASALVSNGATRGGAPVPRTATVVITGAHAAAIGREVERLQRLGLGPLRTVHNPNWEAGRTGGLALAARELSGRALCIAPIDVPLVPASVFAAIAAAWRAAEAPAMGWLAPALSTAAVGAGGVAVRPGHPIAIGARLAARLLALDPSTPLRELRALANPLWTVNVDAPEILDDLDTPLDLARLRKRLRGAGETGPR